MCDLERKITCGSHVPGKLNKESLKFRKELARLALEKMDFNKCGATEKVALFVSHCKAPLVLVQSFGINAQ
jgi:hypothetical protein